MIIAKPEWFKRRKYTGWGVDIKTWQVAVYIAGMILALALLQLINALFLNNLMYALIVTGIWALFFLDMLDVMWKLKKDERERIHEAIAERNAAWGMIVILSLGLLVELTYNALQQKIYVDPFLVAALVVGVILKSVTNYQLEKEN